MTEQRVRHIPDADNYFNGSDGDWTVCGLPWPPPDEDPTAIAACPACLETWVPTHERRGSR